MRYLNVDIKRDLAKKAILLAGPRQCGKTTLAKNLDNKGYYLNWDIRQDQKIIREETWPKNAPLIILDELHKLPRWKNYLKGVIDRYLNNPPLLITGSARLETFRKQGDALTGRSFYYRLHPIDTAESHLFLPNLSVNERMQRLLITGGFPEAFLDNTNAERLRNDRFDLVIREDLLDLSRVSALRNIEILLELLRERVGSGISFTNLAQDIGVSPPTIKSWIELLERLYLIFIVPPYHEKMARSLKKEPKIYFFDCAAAYEANEQKAARVENLVACSLLKYCHWVQDRSGIKMQLYYFRDRDKREVDFVVTSQRKVKWCIEVKMSDESLSTSLNYLNQKLAPEAAIQLVFNAQRATQKNGVHIIPAAGWLETLF